jgi:DNA mismatch repair protein MutS2
VEHPVSLCVEMHRLARAMDRTSQDLPFARVTVARVSETGGPRSSAIVPTSDPALPDLLSATPTLRLDARKTEEALTFGFAQGIPESTWEGLFAAATLPDTTWDPDVFARDLFVAELATSCRAVTVDGARLLLDARWLERILVRPPIERTTVELRRGVLEELAGEDPTARRDVEKVYAHVRRLRAQLAVTPLRHTDVIRRRLDVLGTLRATIDAIADGFGDARSALARARTWATRVRAGDPYRALVDVLDYDDHLATVDVRVRVGADGRVRGLALAKVRENETSRSSKICSRWWSR